MRCTVFGSETKAFHYIYLAEGIDFANLPELLRQSFAEPNEIMSLDLGELKRLAHADIETVKKQLKLNGYYLQFPPDTPIDQLISKSLS